MKTKLIKPIIAGVLLGAALFWIPFMVARMLMLLLIVGIVIRLFVWMRRRRNPEARFAFADRIRNLSDEEYAAFKQNPRQFCHHRKQKA